MGRPIKRKYFGEVGAGASPAGEGVVTIVPGGTNNNYTSKPSITITPPTLPGGIQAVASVGHMTAKSATITSAGTGSTNQDYAPTDLLSVAGTGTKATFIVDSVSVRSSAVVNLGNGFVTGDYVTFSGAGWSTPANLSITSDITGNVTAIGYNNRGVYTGAVLPTDPVTPTTYSGTGADATFNLGFQINAITLVNGGSYTALVANPAATTSNSSTGGTGATLTVNYGIADVVVGTQGDGYATFPTVGTSPSGNATFTGTLTNASGHMIACSAWIPGGSSAKVGDIVKQTGARTFKVTTADGTGKCKLVTTVPAAGEMNITATFAGSQTFKVMKITDRVVYSPDGARWLWTVDPAGASNVGGMYTVTIGV